MPSSLQGVLPALSHLYLKIVLLGKYCFSDFTTDKSEAEILCNLLLSGKANFYPSLLSTKPMFLNIIIFLFSISQFFNLVIFQVDFMADISEIDFSVDYNIIFLIT